MKNNFFLIVSFFFVCFSCSESELVNESGSITLSNVNLPELPESYQYGAWLLLNGTFVNTGTFNISDLENGRIDFSQIDVTDLGDADAFAITIEETSGSQAPSNFVFLVGDFVNNTANLSLNSTTTQGVKTIVVDATAAVTIQTPSTTENTDEQNGLWFFNTIEEAIDSSTLNLNFPSDVNYQAWLRTNFNGNTIALNLGKISANNTADNANTYIINTTDLPTYAGEDFLSLPNGSTLPNDLMPLDVRGQELVITAIPTNYNSNEVLFPIEVFNLMIPSNTILGANNPIDLQVNQDTYSLTVTR